MNCGEFWQGLCAGKCGIDTIKAFDPVGFTCKLAGEVGEYKIRDYVPKSHRKATKLMSRDIELSVIAAAESLADAGIVTKATEPENTNIDPKRMSINLGAGLISCDLVEIAPAVAASLAEGKFDIHKWGKEGIEQVTPLWLLKYLPNMLACHIGIIHDIQGPSNSITCGEAGSHLAIIESAQIIARGDSDIALAGGAEAKVNPIVMIRQCLLNRATSESNDDAESACRPFDADAKGSVFGEGAGAIILEERQKAEPRGARIYCEVAGVGQSNNINSAYERLESDGKGIQIAIEKALDDAEVKANDIDLIIPHGTGIGADDLSEAKGIEAALGEAVKDIPVFPTKSMLSNMGAASGALDIIAGVCAIRDSKIPAAKNFKKKTEGCNLNIITKSLEKKLRNVLCCSYTYGGQTAAIILKNIED
jgi:3-oxoacyl-[acyl-carrier-protein] synthase II